VFLPSEWRQVSVQTRLFVSSLLCKNPRRRPTAAKALADAWLTSKAGPEAASLPGDLVENLRRFKSQDVFSKAVLHVVAGLLDDAEVSALRSAFVALDADGDGRLSPRELQEGLRLSGLSFSEQELLEILEGMDINGNGAIEYTEFLAAAVDRSKCQCEGLCRRAFEVLDWDGDGQISPQDVKRALRHRSPSSALGAEFQAIAESMPVDRDSSLSLSDFTAILYR
jgi:calcium-dependent protein kinase